MDNSDGNQSHNGTEQPSNWRDQADGFADDFANDVSNESPAIAHDEPSRQWATLR